MSDGLVIVAIACLVVFWASGIVLMSLMVHTYRTDWGYKPVEDNIIGQLNRDWQKVPFVDIKAIQLSPEQPDCPADYSEEVLTEPWFGMNYMCDCLHRKRGKKEYRQYNLNKRCSKGEDASQNDCLDSPATHAVIQSNFNGYKLCGKTGNLPFVIAQRPKYKEGTDSTVAGETLECADGWLPCDPKGIPDYTYCYQEGQSAEQQCPVTSIEFQDNDIGKVKIGRKGTSLPIVSTQLATSTPCLNPFKKPFDPVQKYYMQEIARQQEFCQGERDERWVDSGFKINEYDLQAKNGVLDLLESYYHFTHTVFPGSSVKKQTIYSAWVRPTVPWSLKCEDDTVTRRQVYDSLNQGLTAVEPSNGRGLTIAALVVIAAGPFMFAEAGEAMIILCPFIILVAAGLIIAPLVKLFNYIGQIHTDLEFLNGDTFSFISECSHDGYDLKPDGMKTVLLSNLVHAQSIGYSMIVWLILIVLLPIMGGLLACCDKHRIQENCEGMTKEARHFFIIYKVLN